MSVGIDRDAELPCLDEEAFDEALDEGGEYFGDDLVVRLGLLGLRSSPNLRDDAPGEGGGVAFALEELFFFEKRLRLLFSLPFFADTDVSVTSNPSCMIDPGTGRSGPT